MTETQIDKQPDPPEQDDDENSANGTFNETEDYCEECGEVEGDCICDADDDEGDEDE